MGSDMTCSTDKTLQVTRGSCIDFDVDFTDPDGVAIDITGMTIAVAEASDPVLEQFTITMPDAANGVAHFHMEETVAAGLPDVSTMRISRVDSGHTDNTDTMWIEVI